MPTKAIYIISYDNVLHSCYINIQLELRDLYDIIIIKNTNINDTLDIIKNDIKLNKYYNICFLGWSSNCNIITQIAYIINTSEKKKYIQGLVFLTPYDIDIFLLNMIKCNIIFIHGLNDTIILPKNTEKYYNNYEYNKKIFLLENQNHNYTNKTINEFIINIFTNS